VWECGGVGGGLVGEKLLNTKCVFGFSLKPLSGMFIVLRRIWRDIIIN
jgi:hypothetical protein